MRAGSEGLLESCVLSSPSVLITDLYSTGEHLHLNIQPILRALLVCVCVLSNRPATLLETCGARGDNWACSAVLNRSLSTVLQVPASFSPLCSFSITPCLFQVYQAIQFPSEDHSLQHMKKSTCFHNTPQFSLSLSL